MTFRRVEGFTGCTPQRFIDRNVPKCPMCGSSEPCWTIDEDMDAIPKYLFKCENCDCILSSPTSDVYNFSRAMLTEASYSKWFAKKIRKTFRFKIEKVRSSQATNIHENSGITLEDLFEFVKLT